MSTANATTLPAVVFIHGIGGGARAWQRECATFEAAGLRALAVDLPGYGGRPPLPSVTFDGLAADLEETMARQGMERPVLVGHSLGGMVAQTALRRRPDGYHAVVLCATSPAFGNASGDFQKKFVANRLGPLDAGRSMAELAGALVDGMMGSQPDPAGRALAIEVMSAVPPATYRAVVRALVSFDERANLPRIAVPVLCLAGAADRTAPAAVMERMAARIPGARFASLAGVGHLPNLEAPAAFDPAVLDFLCAALPGAAA